MEYNKTLCHVHVFTGRVGCRGGDGGTGMGKVIEFLELAYMHIALL